MTSEESKDTLSSREGYLDYVFEIMGELVRGKILR